jgi:hypothetical protein
MLVDLLQRREDQLLRFLEIAVVKMGEDLPDFVEVDLVGAVPAAMRATTMFCIWAGNDRRHFFQFSPRWRQQRSPAIAGGAGGLAGEYMSAI